LPQHKSAAKRMKTNEKARLRNKKVKSGIRVAFNEFNDDKEKNTKSLAKITKVLDKAASRNVIHKKKASRLKSRLAKQINAKKD